MAVEDGLLQLLELVEEAAGIENLDHLGQFLLLLERRVSLTAGAGSRGVFALIIHTTKLFPVTFFRQQLHRGAISS